jgi:hypothetical protein
MRIVQEINAFLRVPSGKKFADSESCRNLILTLKNLSTQIFESGSPYGGGGSGGDEQAMEEEDGDDGEGGANSEPPFSRGNRIAGIFVSLGGCQLLMDIVMRVPLANTLPQAPGASNVRRDRHTLQQTKVVNETMGLLREIIFVFPQLAKTRMFGSEKFILYLFDQLLSGHTFDATVGLLEEIISTRKEIFLLDRVPRIHQILLGLSQRQLTLFCRVLALVVFEPDLAPGKKDEKEGEDDSDAPLSPSTPTGGQGDRTMAMDAERADEKGAMGLFNEPNAPGSPSTPTKLSPGYRDAIGGSPKKTKKRRKISLLEDRGANARKGLNAIDRNHACVISCPKLLDRLVKLIFTAVTALPAAEHYRHNMNNTPYMNQQMLMMLTEQNSTNDWEEDRDEEGASTLSNTERLSNTIEGLGSGSISSMIMAMREAMQLNGFNDPGASSSGESGGGGGSNVRVDIRQITLSTHLVEILFVVAIIAAGKRRNDVQRRLMNLNLGVILNDLYDSLNWDFEPRQNHGPHGPGCQCNTSSAVKIQFLRLTHNFCERTDTFRKHKLQLLSEAQLVARKQIRDCLRMHEHDEALGLAAQASQTSNAPQGLLSKLLKLLMAQKEDAYAGYRFWMCTSVEAFLRLGPIEDQLLVASTPGFLEHLVTDIINMVGADCHGLQTNFDLLGEIVKFNSLVLVMIDRILDEDKFRRFMDVVSSHLVDSNVFIRSLIITLEFEKMRGSKRSVGSSGSKSIRSTREYVGTVAQTTKFFKYLAESKLRLFSNLCTLIDVMQVSQENLCCLNTTIIVLIFARREGVLHHYVQSLRDLEAQWNSPGSVITNFRRLLWFWRRYYHSKGHDRLSLENSARIPFAEYLETVDIVCADDNSPCALCKNPQWESEWEYLVLKRAKSHP